MCPKCGNPNPNGKCVMCGYELPKPTAPVYAETGPLTNDGQKRVILISTESNCWDDGAPQAIGPYANKAAAEKAAERLNPNLLFSIVPVHSRTPRHMIWGKK